MNKTITPGPVPVAATMKKIVVRRTGPVRLTSASCYGYGNCCCSFVGISGAE